MEKTYQIIYNTESKDDSTKWKIICGKEEKFVSNFYTKLKTREKFTCEGFLTITDNVAYLTTTKNISSIKRHLFKTISYRIMATSITIGTALILGLDIEASALLGVGEIMIKPVFYFIHERLWFKFRFNKK